jgi:hypothetical protein
LNPVGSWRRSAARKLLRLSPMFADQSLIRNGDEEIPCLSK